MVALGSCRCAGHHEGPKATKITKLPADFFFASFVCIVPFVVAPQG
jgi:hypothetical protein